jgi:hypothetical protein
MPSNDLIFAEFGTYLGTLFSGVTAPSPAGQVRIPRGGAWAGHRLSSSSTARYVRWDLEPGDKRRKLLIPAGGEHVDRLAMF